jgi:outer membrane protein, multidrug efflux system
MQVGGGTGGGSGPGGDANQSQRIRNASLDASWELDVVGGARRGREAGIRRMDAREADWHDARVLIAAEVANQYVNLRTCEVLLTGYEVDAKSRAETARLTTLKKDAGFESPAAAALAKASSAESMSRLAAQKADCAIVVKILAELTATPEEELQKILAPNVAKLPEPKAFAIGGIPAEVISQRPDVASAEYDLAASLADIGVAIADRFPRISLTGTIGYQAFSSEGFNSNGRTWSYGPLLSLPIFDAGRRAAAVDVARARHDEMLAAYQVRTLRAVREVEESLVRLDSANRRQADANTALEGYQTYLRATEASVRAGAGSLPELEDARRATVAAQGVAVGVSRERLLAWVSLYRAVGGGWQQPK